MSRRLLLAACVLLSACGNDTASVEAPARADDSAPPIIAWGDSLTEGVQASSPDASYPADLARLIGRDVINEGVSGETSREIAARQSAAAPDSRGWVNLFWMGRNNAYEADQVLADIAACVARLQTDRYVILSLTNGRGEGRTTAFYGDVMSINQQLASRYPDHYLDVRQMLVDHYDPLDARDQIDHLEDIVPQSLRGDDIHLNDAGYFLVAQSVAQFLGSHGW